jgi:CYTH domain-containing protein
MAIEIERKFLVTDDSWKAAANGGEVCKQGYIVSDEEKTVRIRIMGDAGYLTVKGSNKGFSRLEFEYEIDRADAVYMLTLCGDVIEKTRYLVNHDGMTWEVDVFEGDNAGLVMAEVELDSEDQRIDLPSWAGEEVTDDARYYNACLSKHPFGEWAG